MQNIGADNAGDAFYRYKMPKLVAKVEGRGNGIKTNIVNNVEIARALDRPPTYTLKHFGCELGAQTNFNKDTGISIVNGKHDEKKLSEVLEIFIKKYVQCHSCGNPETVVKIRKECIFLKCKACGHTSDVDMRDKLTTFILKNPPENKVSKQEAKVRKQQREREKAAEKQARKALKEKKKKDRKDSSKRSTKSEDSPDDDADNDDEDNADDEDEDETEWKTDLSADAVAQRQREQLTKAAAMLVQGADDKAAKDAEGGTSKNGAELSEHEDESVEKDEDSASAQEDEEDEEEELEGVDLVRKYMNEKAPLAFAADMESLEASIVPRMKLFYEAVLSGCQGPATEVMQAKDKYIYAMGRDSTMQASQLIALEHYVTQVEPERMKEMPFILKWLYEEDLIDDAIIIAWGGAPNVAKKHGVDKESARSVREVSKAVLEWLEEDSDEEDEEE